MGTASEKFETLHHFFMSWGLYPLEEDTVDLSPAVVRQGINRCCYHKLLDEARRMGGDNLAELCSRMLDTADKADDAFYLPFDTWQDLQEELFELDEAKLSINAMLALN